jgi:hypothetical protein
MYPHPHLIIDVHPDGFGYFQRCGESVGDRVLKSPCIGPTVHKDFKAISVNECRRMVPLQNLMLDCTTLDCPRVGFLPI